MPFRDKTLPSELEVCIAKLSVRYKDQTQYETIKGVKLPVAEIGIPVRKITRIPILWAMQATKFINSEETCELDRPLE